MSTRFGYLPDTPLDDFDAEDALRHRGLVATLSRIIEDAPTPFCIGLLGTWGIGKTSITRAVKAAIEETDDTRCIEYDAWKYDASSFRAEVIREAYRQSRKRLPPETEEAINYDTSTTRSGRAEFPSSRLLAAARDALHRCLVMVLMAAPLAMALALGAWLLPQYVVPAALPWDTLLPLLIGVFIGIVSGAIKAFPIFVVEAHTQSRPMAERPSEFACLFRALIRDLRPRKGGRLVFVIDNLDRCSPETATEILGMLNTFLAEPGCTYVVACDDEAIVRHLAELPGETCKSARARLDKVFNLTVRIPPASPVDMAPLIESLAERIDEPLPSGVCDALAWAVAHTPRDAVQYVNDYKAAMAALEKQQEDKAVTYSDADAMANAVAKTLVLRKRFPQVYAQLVRTPSNLTLLEKHARDGELENPISDVPVLEDLLGFLSETEMVEPEAAMCALWLKDPIVNAEFGHLNGFLERLAGVSDMREEYLNLDEEARRRWRSAAVEGLNYLRRHGTAGRTRTMVRLLAEFHGDTPDTEKRTLANAIARALGVHKRPLAIGEFAGSDLLPALLDCSDALRKRSIERILEALSTDTTEGVEWLRVLLHYGDRIPQEFAESLWGTFAEVRSASPDAPEIAVLAAALVRWQETPPPNVARALAASVVEDVTGSGGRKKTAPPNIVEGLEDYRTALPLFAYLGPDDRDALFGALFRAQTDDNLEAAAKASSEDAVADARRQVLSAVAALDPRLLGSVSAGAASPLATVLADSVSQNYLCDDLSVLKDLDQALSSLEIDKQATDDIRMRVIGRSEAAAAECGEALAGQLQDLTRGGLVAESAAAGLLHAIGAGKLSDSVASQCVEAIDESKWPALVMTLINRHSERAAEVVTCVAEGIVTEGVAEKMMKTGLRQLPRPNRQQRPDASWVSWFHALIPILDKVPSSEVRDVLEWVKQAIDADGTTILQQEVLRTLEETGPAIARAISERESEESVKEVAEALVAELVHIVISELEQAEQSSYAIRALGPFAERLDEHDQGLLNNSMKRKGTDEEAVLVLEGILDRAKRASGG